MKDAAIKELLTRGVERIYPSTEFLESRLKSGKSLTLYLGIDPTGPTLHVGHMIPLLKLRQFQDLGHKVILLIGDFTGMIGDPTDKSAARKRLTREEVLENAKLYKTQAGKIIGFDGKNPAELRYNSEWLGKLSFADGLELCAHMSHAQVIKRDMFQKRIAEGKDLYMHEFLYPLMQGYDSVVMDVDGEVGGNDQTFNMLVGRDLMKKMKNHEKFVVATKLLTDSVGAKMGKTEGNMVAFSDTSTDCFGKVMSWPDSMILAGFELCTRIPMSDIKTIKVSLEDGENPKNFKQQLAEEITALIHGGSEAIKARDRFEATFTKSEPSEFLEIEFAAKAVAEVLVKKGIVESKSDLRRLIKEGALTNLDTNQKVGEEFLTNTQAGRYRIGKHRFVRITE
ncbi:MAG: tyrosine--tRNA ligase [bacterium]|nr:tyrosine--tRNA ligase [bacterium]